MVNVLRRLRAYVRYRHFDRDVREELTVHRAMAVDNLRSTGVAEDDVRRQVARQLGNVTLARESSRRVWMASWLESAWQDIRTGFRMILKSPQLTATALLSLAIGIGANSAVFSMLLRPMPYPDAERLVMVRAAHSDRPDRPFPLTPAEFLAWRNEASRTFEAIGTEAEFTRDIGADAYGSAETIAAQNLSANMFAIVGARPALGRVFRADEEGFDGPNSAARVVVISDALWRRRFNSRADAVGTVIRFDGVPTTIIGVMPPRFGFHDARATDAWGPRTFLRTQLPGSNRVLPVLGKLRPGVTIDQAQSEIEIAAARVADTLPPQSKGWSPRLMPFQEYIYGREADSQTLMLAGAVGFVLLIACANVAALLLTRAVSRQTEIAVRAAIGASRPRLIRQLLTESFVLSLLGAIVGIALAWLLLRTLGSFGPSPAWMERPYETVLDVRVLAFTVIVSVVTSLLFGTTPAIGQSRVDLTKALSGGKALGGTAHSQRLRSGLVMAQVALAMVLLVGAGLLINGFARVRAADLGADVNDVLTFRLQFSNAAFIKTIGSFNKQTQLVEVSPIPSQTFMRVQEALEALPGVEAVGASHIPPFTGFFRPIGIRIEGHRPAADGEVKPTAASLEIVSRRFFHTLRIPIVRGREFDERDTIAGPLGLVINEEMATEYWPNENPIGKRVQWLDLPDDRPREVIGVIRTLPRTPGETEARPVMYALHSQQLAQSAGNFGGFRLRMTFVIRPRVGQAQTIAPALRDIMTSIDPNKAIADFLPLDAIVDQQLAWVRHRTTLVAVFAAAATLLTAIGVYGLTASTVTQRTREIGIRMALGATESDVLVPVVRRAMVLIVMGLAFGVTGAWFITRLFASLHWWVTPTDIWAYLTVSTVMLIIGMVACFVPAWRVVRMPPTVALRCE